MYLLIYFVNGSNKKTNAIIHCCQVVVVPRYKTLARNLKYEKSRGEEVVFRISTLHELYGMYVFLYEPFGSEIRHSFRPLLFESGYCLCAYSGIFYDIS